MADQAELIQHVRDTKRALDAFVPKEELQRNYDDAVLTLLDAINADDEPEAPPVIDATHEELPDFSAYNGAAE